MPREISIEKVQGYFNAINQDQLEKARNFEKRTLNIVNDLIAPLPIAN